MKICILSYYFGPKLGIGNYLDNLLPVIEQESNHDIYIITNNNFITQSTSISSLKNSKIYENKWLNKGTIISVLYLLFFFSFFIKKEKIDLLFIPTNPIIGFFISCKILSVIHDINEYEIKNKYGFYTFFRKKIYIKRTLSRSDNIIVISNFVLKQISSKLKLKQKIKDKISVIHNGINSQNSDKVNVSKENLFISVGRIDPISKNLYFLLDFFFTIKKFNAYKDYKLLLLGGINKSSEKLSSEFLEKIKDFKDIEYLGFVSDERLNYYYKKAEACILMSKYEGFGFPLLEAYSNGCKVIRHSENEAFNEISGGLDLAISENDINNPRLENSMKEYLNKDIDFNHQLSLFNWNEVGKKYTTLMDRILQKSENRIYQYPRHPQ